MTNFVCIHILQLQWSIFFIKIWLLDSIISDALRSQPQTTKDESSFFQCVNFENSFKGLHSKASSKINYNQKWHNFYLKIIFHKIGI